MVDRALAIRVMNGVHHVEIPKPPSGWGDFRVIMAWAIFSEAVLFLTLISSAYYARLVLYQNWSAALSHVPHLLTPLAIFQWSHAEMSQAVAAVKAASLSKR
jgi:Cytochrome C oxidase subunit I /III